MICQPMSSGLPQTGEGVHFMINILRTITPCIWKPPKKYSNNWRQALRFSGGSVTEVVKESGVACSIRPFPKRRYILFLYKKCYRDASPIRHQSYKWITPFSKNKNALITRYYPTAIMQPLGKRHRQVVPFCHIPIVMSLNVLWLPGSCL